VANIVQIINSLKEFIEKDKTLHLYRQSACDFTRESKLGFCKTIYLELHLMRNSLDTELYNSLLNNNLEDISKSAYSQSRYKIKHKIYIALNHLLLKMVYKPCEHRRILRFAGYAVHAVDGTRLILPNTKELKAHFGTQQGGSEANPTHTAMSLLMCCYDVLNRYIVQSELNDIKTGEQTVAKNWVQNFDSQAITIFDRGFASMFFCHLMLKYNKPFIIRAKLGFNNVVKDFVASDAMDSIVTFEASNDEIFGTETMKKGTKIQVRLVKIMLPNNKIEVLITSLFDTEIFHLNALNELYQMRWGIETAYDKLKNQLLIMCFSGLKPEAILQDVYATIFVHNLQQLFINQAQITVNEQTINCEHEYQVNTNVATGIFRHKIMGLFLAKRPKKIIQDLLRIFVKKRIPKIKNKKSQPRKKSIAKRRNLITYTNFKRA
jgi:Transposase DDE domain